MQPPPPAQQPDPMTPANPLEPGYLTQLGYPAQPEPGTAPGTEQGQLVPPARAVPPRAPQPSVQPAPPNQMPNQAQPSQAPGQMPNQMPGQMTGRRPQPNEPNRGATDAGLVPPADAGLVPPAHAVAPPRPAAGPAANRAPDLAPANAPSGANASGIANPSGAANAARETQAAEPLALSSLMRLPIVDLSTGRRVGRVDDIIVSSDHRSVEAYVSHSGFLRGTHAFPARDATIGQDAITLPPGALDRFDKRSLRGLPLAGGLAGTRLLSDGGRVLGTVKDVRMDPRTAEVAGYEVTPEDRNLLDRLRHHTVLLPVAAVQRRGTDAWIVAEQDAQRHFG